MSIWKRKLGSLAVAAVGLVAGAAAFNANAALVSQWKVDVNAIFDVNSICDSTGDCTAPTGVTVVDNKTLRWGASTGQGQSGLDLTNTPISTLVNTNGAAVPNVSITHLNRPITGTTLSSLDIISTLTLTPNVPPAAGLPSTALVFKVNYLETPNGANPCANGIANGVGVNGAGCADIYVTNQNSLNFPFFYDLGDGPVQYFISFFEATSGLNPLPTAACNAVIGSSPCLGFMTPEGQDTTVRFAALITTAPVSIPEPGTLALLGGSLFGLAALRRRRKA